MATPLPIVVLISGEGKNLQAIIDAAQAQHHIDIKAVISNNSEAHGLERARLAGIPTHALAHSDYPTRSAFEEALIKVIDSYQPEWVILAGFMRRLEPDFVDHYAHRILNIHPSLLPKYPGLHTHAAVLAAGEKVHGASIHWVDHGVDSGPLICQARVAVSTNDSVESLKHKVMNLETQLYPLVLSWLAESRLKMGPSGPQLDGQALPSQGLQLESSAEGKLIV